MRRTLWRSDTFTLPPSSAYLHALSSSVPTSLRSLIALPRTMTLSSSCDCKSTARIETLRRAGYRFVADAAPDDASESAGLPC